MRLDPADIRARAREARKLSSPCRLCPRQCGVNRLAGESGYCGAGADPSVAAVVPHFGEEPPICGSGGAGTIFFCRCNLRCVYCQNHQISQGPAGSPMLSGQLSEAMLRLQAQGCSTIEPVSPSHHLPGLLEALAAAAEQGLRLPVVYNSNGYESTEVLELLDGVVDVYLPDIKYAGAQASLRYSDVPNYVEIARSAVLKMHGQVGSLVVSPEGIAERGLIIRLLVLPEDVSGTNRTLRWIRENLPSSTTISLMAQYSPLHRATDFPPLDRPITQEEYDRVVDFAWDLGFDEAFIQETDARNVGVPDFQLDKPFIW